MVHLTKYPFKFPLIRWKLSLLTQLLLLAVTVLIYSVMGMAIANSLFVSHVGAGQLPISFILIGLCSLPAYGLFSQVVDRYSRPALFRTVLFGSIVLALGLRALLTVDAVPVYYALLIFIFFQWDFHNNVLYPTLLTDYFTTLEYKRYAPYVGIAQAVGTLLGGGITTLVTRWISTPDLLLGLPLVFAIAIGQLFYLERSQRSVSAYAGAPQPQTTEEPTGLWEAIASFPALVKRYPLALLLAASSFLLVIIYISSEFLWFNIYGQSFSEQELTQFLGLMRIVISLIQVAVIYGLTRPLLQTVGVARMNPVYPLTTLASLVGLAFNVRLPAAIILHVNGDALYKAINIPVHQLNYNAIPREFIGRIRALSDGVIYAMGLTLAGVMLWVCHHMLTLAQITWIAAGLTIVLVAVRWPMGSLYGHSLEEMIRANTIRLDAFTDTDVPLPSQSSSAIQELLTSPVPRLQTRGLELAASYTTPSDFLDGIQALIQPANPPVYQAALALFSTTTDPLMERQCRQWLETSTLELQVFALATLVVREAPLDAAQIHAWQCSDHPVMAVLAAVAARQQELETGLQSSPHPSLTHLPNEAIALNTLSSEDLPIVLGVARCNANAIGPDLLQPLVAHPNTETVAAVLETLLAQTTVGDEAIATLAVNSGHHSSPRVRELAFQILGKTRCPQWLDTVAAGLNDGEARVRQQASKALAAYGKAGVEQARTVLRSEGQRHASRHQIKGAIATIGMVRTRYASDILFDYLAPDRQQVLLTRKWLQQIPQDDPSWRPLAIAINDYHQRVIQQMLYVLSCLGYGPTVDTVSRILETPNHQDTENAIEVLATLGHRRFIVPILPLLELQIAATGSAAAPQSPSQPDTTPATQATRTQWFRTKGYKILLEALDARDRWIRIGAMMALSHVPSILEKDPDPLVQSIVREVFPSLAAGSSPVPSSAVAPLSSSPLTPDVPATNDPTPIFPTLNAAALSITMNRVLLLKNVSLFKNLSLDEILLIDQAIEQQQVFAQQTIYSEGNWGSHFYIIAEGTVRLTKTIDGAEQDIRTLTKENYFGEIALFDDAPRWDSAIAVEDCVLLKLEKTRFISLITQRPHIILEVCRFLSQRLRETDTYRLKHSPSLLSMPTGEGVTVEETVQQ